MSFNQNFFNQRRAGILLHPTSLPEIKDTYRFIDFLADSGVSIWQMLPLGPPHDDLSPYGCQSVHAANPALINSTNEEVNKLAFEQFVETQQYWLEDYVLFRALHNKFKTGWWEWEPALRDRQQQALNKARQDLAKEIEQHRLEQFLFFTQWQQLKQYANQREVYLFGDIPIFVAQDSVDVWANRENFLLDAQGQPTVVAGVPPDYFSATGQRWGNPLYDWEYMQANDFNWWKQRLKTTSMLFDVARIDHFRGFEACWTIPASCKTAIEGEWVKAPGAALFKSLQQSDINLPLVAEDLGIITEEVKALRDQFGLPGMKILQFAFDGNSDNPYLPHNHIENSVVYTGTHDNNTTLGWFQEQTEHTQQYIREYLHTNLDNMPWALIEAAFASKANWAIVPMQDILSLDANHRMNIPGIATGNWRWRFNWSQLSTEINDKLRHLSNIYARK
jgi:4-alpha-glucanotransferase